MNETTRILQSVDQGDPHAAAQLLPLVYRELKGLAAQLLAREQAGQTLQPPALVPFFQRRVLKLASAPW